MKVEKKEKSPCVFELTVRADAEEIKADYKQVLNAFVREGVVPGFRKGKAPVDVIKRKFQAEIQQEAIQTCFRKFYPEAVKESGLDVLELDGLSEAVLTSETGFTFTAIVEVKPVFDLPKYKKLAIKKGDTAVTDEQVDKRVEDFRAAFAKYEEAAADAVVATGDFVNFDYTGTLKGQPLAEIVPDEKAVCAAEGFWTQVEEGRFLPEILEALKGMKAGESKTGVKVKFPKDNAPEALKGKTCAYDITLKSFRSRVLPDDAALLEHGKVDSLDALKTKFRGELEKEAEAAEQESRRTQAIDLLLKKADFDVPPVLVRQQTQYFIRDLAQRAQYSGLPADYFEKNRDAILADAESNAVRQVRLSYILAGIAKAEAFEITDDDVTQGLEKMAAARANVTAADLRKQLEENGQIEGYKEQLRAEKALDFVLAEAK
jgi:trigger factor